MDPLNYLQQHSQYFWQWEENGTVLSIPNGSTIAYKDFIFTLFQSFNESGLPPFGTLLLAVIATNNYGKADINKVFEIVNALPYTKNHETLQKAKKVLETISELPDNYKTRENRMQLLYNLLANAHNKLSVQKTSQIIYFAISPKNEVEVNDTVTTIYIPPIELDFKPFALLAEKYDSVESILKDLSNVPDFKTIKIETEKVAELIAPQQNLEEALINHHETFFIGAMIKTVRSGLNIPVHSALPSIQPLGGVADLSNKGDLDRLLITEFAYDDDIFLQRLANNESLYLNREIPPIKNELERVFLIDISIHNWGTIKSIAYAILLAIAHHPKTDILSTAFVVGKTAKQIQFKTIHELIAGIQHLDTTLHAANGIKDFFATYSGKSKIEVFYIYGKESQQFSEIKNTLADFKLKIHYWIALDEFGNIDVFKRQQNSKKHIQHILLPLKSLFETKSKSLQNTFDQTTLHNLPLLVNNARNFKRILVTDNDEVFIITHTKYLFKLYNHTVTPKTKGWELILGDLPVTFAEFCIGKSKNGTYYLCYVNFNTQEVGVINLENKQNIKLVIPESISLRIQGITHKDNMFNLHYRNNSYCVDYEGNLISFGSTKDVYPQLEDMKKKESEIEKLHINKSNIFKNIKSVHISSNQNLVFNKHELIVDKLNNIRMETNFNIEYLVSAIRIDNNKFSFGNGFNIEMHDSGVIIISNNTKDNIYLIPGLKTNLAISTESEFAGNLFYYKDEIYNINILSPIASPLMAIKVFKKVLDIPTIKVKQIIDTKSITKEINTTLAQAHKLKHELESSGVKSEIIPAQIGILKESVLQVIEPEAFFKKIITPYITAILNNGA